MHIRILRTELTYALRLALEIELVKWRGKSQKPLRSWAKWRVWVLVRGEPEGSEYMQIIFNTLQRMPHVLKACCIIRVRLIGNDRCKLKRENSDKLLNGIAEQQFAPELMDFQTKNFREM